ncbi:MAG: SEC-C metal-binding domain-containing protein, partial [Desulfoferrobacter sp.]
DRPLKILGQLLRRGLPAEQVMQVLAQENAASAETRTKVGRNAPCPCGSGIKFKKCHGGLGNSEDGKAGPTPVQSP